MIFKHIVTASFVCVYFATKHAGHEAEIPMRSQESRPPCLGTAIGTEHLPLVRIAHMYLVGY